MRKRDMQAPRPPNPARYCADGRQGPALSAGLPATRCDGTIVLLFNYLAPMAVAWFPASLTAPVQAPVAVPRAVRQVQAYFAAVFVAGLAAFVLGVEGRFPGGLF